MLNDGKKVCDQTDSKFDRPSVLGIETASSRQLCVWKVSDFLAAGPCFMFEGRSVGVGSEKHVVA